MDLSTPLVFQESDDAYIGEDWDGTITIHEANMEEGGIHLVPVDFDTVNAHVSPIDGSHPLHFIWTPQAVLINFGQLERLGIKVIYKLRPVRVLTIAYGK